MQNLLVDRNNSSAMNGEPMGNPLGCYSVRTLAGCIAIGLLLILTSLSGCAAARQAIQEPSQEVEATPLLDSFALLREATDHEALYTLAGGLKPMSSGFWRGSFQVEDPDLNELQRVRAALAPLRNDLWYADVQVFHKAHEGERSAHAFVVHRASFAHMIERYAGFWGSWGITPCTHPSEVIAMVDRMPKGDRWRGYGYLYGYPDHAVDFFVETGLSPDPDREVGPGKDREFVHIPTFAAEQGYFTYAVPLAHVTTVADERLAAQAGRMLVAYQQARPRLRNVSSVLMELRRLNLRFASTPSTITLDSVSPSQAKGASHAVLDTR